MPAIDELRRAREKLAESKHAECECCGVSLKTLGLLIARFDDMKRLAPEINDLIERLEFTLGNEDA